MAHLPKDWRFLRLAWIYGVILTGTEAKASELVDAVFKEVSRRQDVVSARRRRRLFFALLRRDAGGAPRCGEGDFQGATGLFSFHQMAEPGRSALALFYTRLFTADQLADILGVPERNLPSILAAARADLEGKLLASA
jgi:hypothetical protein